MLGTSASPVIIVYGERHSHALGSKRPFLLSDCRQVTGSGIRKPGPQAPLFPYLSSPYMLYPNQSSINILRTVHSLNGPLRGHPQTCRGRIS